MYKMVFLINDLPCRKKKRRSKYTALTLEGGKEMNNEHGREGKGEGKKKKEYPTT